MVGVGRHWPNVVTCPDNGNRRTSKPVLDRNWASHAEDSDVAEFSLPAPWGASESELACARCGRTTSHYARRVTLMADEESDRRTGEVAWFCVVCGHKHEVRDELQRRSPPGDDFTEMFDRH